MNNHAVGVAVAVVGVLSLLVQPAEADNRLSSADGIEEAVQMQQAVTSAQYDLMNLWIQCDLDHLCVCEKKQELFKKTDNIVLQVMIQRDKDKDQTKCEILQEHYAQLCRIPAITDVNKALVPCYQKIQQGQFLNDQSLYNAGQSCMAEQLQPFISQKNIYAVYVYVDFLSANPERYPGLLQHFQNEFSSLKASPDYGDFEQCMKVLAQ